MGDGHGEEGMKTYSNPRQKAIEARFAKHHGLGEPPNLIPDKPDPGLESGLLAWAINLCKQKRLRVFHDRSRRKNEPGWGDLFIFLPRGHILLVETKSAMGGLSAEQKQLRQDLGRLGHPVWVGRSREWFRVLLERKIEEVKDGSDI